MASMKETARKNLEKMVKGAAREVVTSRPSVPSRANSPSQTSGATSTSKAPASTPPISVESKQTQIDDKRIGATVAAPDAEDTKSNTGISKSALTQLRSLMEKNGRTIQKVPLESIHLHENIRENYDEVALKHLADSLEKDGLIQFPTLALKDQDIDGNAAFICKNGHRRVLAAKSLGWKTIECVILPFASAKDELYHTIAANLREDVFYLDLASAYQQAARLGESDQAIAERSGVNPRTVGWYRRLTRMSPECQTLCRQHSDIFNATWAIKLARLGELPAPALLLKQMQSQLARQQAFQQASQTERPERIVDKIAMKSSRDQLKDIFLASNDESKFAWNLVDQLCQAGYVTPKVVDRLRKNFTATQKAGSASRGNVKSAV
ncbi:MAG: ParB N-terminal domain-containing protein [Chitinophagaceae bacterium]|nr:ParB N-terminal domain-containing protein [Oligoflexus sp.]